jgi:hypothetical protein
MTQVISASRRTDIPAFYVDWFVNRLKAGAAHVQQPYTNKLIRISLDPNEVSAIIFWSKNYAPLLRKIKVIEKTTKNLFFHFTITANRELESHTPDYRDAIADYIFIARRYSQERIMWRYDPICITDSLSFEIHEERFIRCAEMLKGYAQKCTMSFVHPYKKVLYNLKNAGHALIDLSVDEKRRFAHRLAVISETYGIQLHACCNDYLLSEKIKKASCIDGDYLTEIFGACVDKRRVATRKECACTMSVDIGAYDTCAHGCVYCYANNDKDNSRLAHQRHNPEWKALGKDVTEPTVRTRKKQEKLFQDE